MVAMSIGIPMLGAAGGSIFVTSAVSSSTISISGATTTLVSGTVKAAKFVWKYNKVGVVGAGMNIAYQGSTKGVGGIDWTQRASILAFKKWYVVGAVDGFVDFSFNDKLKFGTQKGINNWIGDTVNGFIYGLPGSVHTSIDRWVLIYNAMAIGAGHANSKAFENPNF